ncbi:hypothetical protein CDAR_566181 [Caerostris darwini]|uniref:Uncharacterized protein n=1 Tax=Caerostris darwini TaxID=1538125 RepID=A0AAV4WJN8_9ARAC|nr:hypothetical protein CDAR_566181 [Caerostris darwini]
MQTLYQRYGGLFVWCSGFYQNNEQDDIKFSCVSLSLSSYSSDVEPKDSYIPSLEEATQDKCKRFTNDMEVCLFGALGSIKTMSKMI